MYDPWKTPLTLDLSVFKCPDGTRNSIGVGGGVEIDILESLRNKRPDMWVVTLGDDRTSVDIRVVAAVQVELQCDVCGQVEIGVERASTVTGLHRLGRGEFPDVVGTGSWPVQTCLNTVTLRLDLWPGQVDFRHDASDIPPAGVPDAAFVLGLESGADDRKALGRLTAGPKRLCKGAEGKEGGEQRRGEVHLVG